MVDRLFLSKNCPDCAAVRAELNMDAATQDSFRGKAGQELRVYSALSNAATRELLDKFEFDGKNGWYTPLLVPHDGSKPRMAIKDILAWLRDNGMTD